MPLTIKRVAQLKTAQDFRDHLALVGANIPFDETIEQTGPLAQTINVNNQTIGNRFCILPMEGWDGTPDGKPSELTIRRWQRFGQSGAKLIWGGEAVAIRHDGRANPNQLVLNEKNESEIASLRETLIDNHRQAFGKVDDLYVGLQLTHSGRFSKPNDHKRWEPRILYRHPYLDQKYKLANDLPMLTDDDISHIIDDYIVAAKRASDLGYQFIDIKHCHGYLGHEFLTAHDRPGKYGGSFENRTRYLRDITAGIKAVAPNLALGVRLSAIDVIPFKSGPDGQGEPWENVHYRNAFGGDGTGIGFDLTEPIAFCKLLVSLGIRMVCTTAGSPYYTPHIQRPAIFPPSDGYLPPEEPLVGVARQIDMNARLKAAVPELLFVGSGYSYLQEWLPNVAQAVVRANGTDCVGLGRLVLSYPELPADVLAGRELKHKLICRTFSDCTTAPRNGIVSGCYPLDPFYKARPEAKELAMVKKANKG